MSMPTDAMPAAEFIIRHLYRSIELNNRERLFAVTETEKLVDGDDWFWSDDNAKVLELLALPQLWHRYSDESCEILRFVKTLCRGPFIFRRVSSPRLEQVAVEGSTAAYKHSLMNIKWDSSRGNLLAGIRFHDERNFDNLMLAGNVVEFSYRRRKFRISVDNSITETDATLTGHVLTVCQKSELFFTPFWKSMRFGRLSYTYVVDARSMLIEVEAALEIDPRAQVGDVVLTVGHDQLSRYLYSAVATDSQSLPFFAAVRPGLQILNAAGASYYALRHNQISGDALALHTLVREPAHLSEIEVSIEHPGILERVLARYHFPGDRRGQRLAVSEQKLLTGGGLYERISDYAGLLREAAATKSTQQGAWDLSISYDYGSKINAFAKCFAVCAAESIATCHRSLAGELRSSFDQYVDYYFELFADRHEQQQHVIFSRDLAFVILGISTMYQTCKSEDLLRRLQRLCDVLLGFEIRFNDAGGDPASGFLMRMDSPRAAYVDCHSAALLALTHAAKHIVDPRLPAAIERGLAGFCIETCAVDVGRPRKIDTISTLMIDDNGNRHTENAFWNFKAGMTLRFFAALRKSPNPELQLVAGRHNERMDLFETILRRQLKRSITEHVSGIEFRTSEFSSETNSETQPWVMLGLVGHLDD